MSQYPPFRFGIVAASSDDSGQTPTEASATELVARGAYPLPNNIRFLSRLKLRTIISLTPDVPTFHHPASPVETIINANATITNTIITSTAIATPDAVRDWVLTESIATVYVRVDAPTDDNEIPLSFKQAALILAHLTNPDSLPAYVHCLSGGVVTGLVCALLRKLMCWSQKSIMGKEYHMPLLFLIFDAAEYARFMAGEEIEGTGVYEFVERFSSEVEISSKIPRWLWPSLNGVAPPSNRRHPTIKLKLTSAVQRLSVLNATSAANSSIPATPRLSSVSTVAITGNNANIPSNSFSKMAQEQQQSQTSQQQNQQKQLQIQQHQQLKKPQQAQHQQYLKPGKDNQEQVAAVLITAASNNIDENNSTIMRTDGMSNGKFVSDSKAPAATILAVKEGSYSRDGGKNEENENNAETDTVSVPVSVPRKKIGTTAAASAAVAGASRASNNNIATALGDDSEISVTLDALDLEM